MIKFALSVLQVAAVIGIGLVYQGTGHRHNAEVLLSEIGVCVCVCLCVRVCVVALQCNLHIFTIKMCDVFPRVDHLFVIYRSQKPTLILNEVPIYSMSC